MLPPPAAQRPEPKRGTALWPFPLGIYHIFSSSPSSCAVTIGDPQAAEGRPADGGSRPRIPPGGREHRGESDGTAATSIWAALPLCALAHATASAAQQHAATDPPAKGEWGCRRLHFAAPELPLCKGHRQRLVQARSRLGDDGWAAGYPGGVHSRS